MQKVVIYEQVPKMDISKVPQHEVNHLARATLQAVERYFEIPGVKEDYEKWLKDYKRRKTV